MKKKRGPKAKHKKGKLKVNLPVNESSPAPGHLNVDDDMGVDENDGNSDSKVESESPTSLGERTRNSLSSDADLPIKDFSLKLGAGRVKVRLKSLRPLDAQHTHSDLQSETDTSQPKVNLPGQILNIDSKEDSAYSDGLTSDLHTAPIKSGNIKIISSKGMDKYLNKKTSSVQILGERGFISLGNENNVDAHVSQKVHGIETGSPFEESYYNERELKDALSVLKKVMKMDAAEPFNAPVDPVALGIPDYFDVIDSPMDFGTVCNNLEHGRKYLNSEDVFKDVQLIWDNCNKYNNKGDYIIDLMKRVKKNFTKYWLAAGLYCEVPGVGAIDATNEEEMKQSHEEKYAKGKISKYKRKRPGSNHHKSGCLCAVCIVRRQKKEREGTAVGSVTGNSDANTYEPILEGGSPIENRDSEPSSTSLSQSPEHHSIVDAEGPEHREMDASEFHHKELGRLGYEGNVMEQHDTNGLSVPQPTLMQRGMQDDTDRPSLGHQDNYRDYEVGYGGYKLNVQDEAGVSDYKQVEKQEEPFGLPNEMELYDDPLREENHSILLICKEIFSRESESIWSGPHSLTPHVRVSSTQASPFHTAVSAFFRR